MSDEIRRDQLLSSTAYWTAAVRGLENARVDHLFSDPWADMLAGTVGKEWIAQRTEDSVVAIVLRTRFYDDFLQRIAARDTVQQIVLMAAGLDTRAYRLPWPEKMRIFEVDQPQVMEYKDRILLDAGAQANCERIAIAADLTTPWEAALIDAGFDTRQPAAWLMEGFLFYLYTEDLTALLDRVLSFAAQGSAVGFDIINSETLTSPYTKAWVEMQAKSGAPWIGTLDDPDGFLSARGWTATLTVPGAPEANFGRWSLPVIPPAMPDVPHLWYVTAEKD